MSELIEARVSRKLLAAIGACLAVVFLGTGALWYMHHRESARNEIEKVLRRPLPLAAGQCTFFGRRFGVAPVVAAAAFSFSLPLADFRKFAENELRFSRGQVPPAPGKPAVPGVPAPQLSPELISKAPGWDPRALDQGLLYGGLVADGPDVPAGGHLVYLWWLDGQVYGYAQYVVAVGE